jgi:hypothetical protein
MPEFKIWCLALVPYMPHLHSIEAQRQHYFTFLNDLLHGLAIIFKLPYGKDYLRNVNEYQLLEIGLCPQAKLSIRTK